MFVCLYVCFCCSLFCFVMFCLISCNLLCFSLSIWIRKKVTLISTPALIQLMLENLVQNATSLVISQGGETSSFSVARESAGTIIISRKKNTCDYYFKNKKYIKILEILVAVIISYRHKVNMLNSLRQPWNFKYNYSMLARTHALVSKQCFRSCDWLMCSELG